MAMTEDEKKSTAYHEAGHALLNVLLPHTDALHKVSIIPRGPSLGVTMFLPEKDKISAWKREELDTLVVLMGGRVARRYPTPDGELNSVRETPSHDQGLPHGFAFVVKRLFNNQPRPILPVFQNTCYPPNQPSAKRSYQLGQQIAAAIKAWDEPARVAVSASGGLSHFVVDEERDRKILKGLEQKDTATLTSLPKERLYSATSESLNWVALGGVMEKEPLDFELVDYVPVYRTPANTGGGWAFGRWQ